jgi:hypothetical protein
MEKERRKRLAALPVAEKIGILERMRDRNRTIAAAGLRKKKPLQPADSTSPKVLDDEGCRKDG